MNSTEVGDKTRRQRTIRALVHDTVIASQDDLARALKRCGFRVTQATLSRDLKELRILRAPTEEGYRYVHGNGDGHGPSLAADAGERRLRSAAVMEVVGVDHNEVGAVVRTLTGRAQGVAVYLDSLRLPDVLGTIAGDDTILVLPKTVKRTTRLARQIAELFGVE